MRFRGAATGGRVGSRAVPMGVAAVLTLLALTGCETTAEESAKLEKVAKRKAHESALLHPFAKGLSIPRPSTKVRVNATVVVHSPEGTAVAVTLSNQSSATQRDIPVEITVKDARGATLYTNTTPGLATALVSMPLLPAHATGTWIDDQVQTSGTPASASAEVGEGTPVSGAIPKLSVQGIHLAEGQLEGSVVNRSFVSQRELVVYALARRGGTIVAAGRAVVPQAEPGTTTHFQAFLIGNAQGAQLEASAPPTTVG